MHEWVDKTHLLPVMLLLLQGMHSPIYVSNLKPRPLEGLEGVYHNARFLDHWPVLGLD